MMAYLSALVSVVTPVTCKTSPVEYPCAVMVAVQVVPLPTKLLPAVVVVPEAVGDAAVPPEIFVTPV